MARKRSKKGTEKHLNLQWGVSWSLEKYFNSGMGETGANRAGKGQWSKNGGKEEKGKRKVTPEYAGAVGKHETLRQIAPRGVGTGV